MAATLAIAGLAGHALKGCAAAPYLLALDPRCVAMKDTTAYIILFHAGLGFILARRDRREFALPVLLVAFATFLLAVGLADEISRLERLGSFDPLASFYPSIMTVSAAVFLALKAVLALACRSPLWVDTASYGAVCIGLSAVLGYALGAPDLYFFIPRYTTAMAINTAVGFLLLGLVPIPEHQ